MAINAFPTLVQACGLCLFPHAWTSATLYPILLCQMCCQLMNSVGGMAAFHTTLSETYVAYELAALLFNSMDLIISLLLSLCLILTFIIT